MTEYEMAATALLPVLGWLGGKAGSWLRKESTEEKNERYIKGLYTPTGTEQHPSYLLETGDINEGALATRPFAKWDAKQVKLLQHILLTKGK